MEILRRGQRGGQVCAILSRQRAIDKYNANPNKCQFCNKVIEIKPEQKVSEVRLKKFCNQSCAALKNNTNRPKKSPATACAICNKPISPKTLSAKYCHTCKFIVQSEKTTVIHTLTKKDIFNSRKNWQSARSAIRQHAYKAYLRSGKEKQCKICGYDKFFEVAHVKSVSDFSGDTLISEINHIDNLVALCRNHHWEYDNGMIELS